MTKLKKKNKKTFFHLFFLSLNLYLFFVRLQNRALLSKAPCSVSDFPGFSADMPYVEDNTHCKLKMFGQQIFQLGNAFVDSVTSLLFDQAMWQLVSLLEGHV